MSLYWRVVKDVFLQWRQRKLSTQIIAILLMPLCALTGLGLRDVWERYRVYEQGAAFEQLSALGVYFGDLIHEYQKERGRTAPYLGAQSGFLSELRQQKATTDGQLKACKTFLHSSPGVARLGARLRRKLGRAQEIMEQLSAHRDAIERRSVKGAAATGFYTMSIQSMMDVIVELSHFSASLNWGAK